MFALRFGVVVILLVGLLVLAAPVNAQESTPTPEPSPTPTPNYQQAVPLSSGNSLLVVNTVTTGDIATVLAVLGLLLVSLLRSFVEIPRIWQQR